MTQDEIIRSPLGRDQIIDLAREASPDMTWYAATEDPTQVATEELEFLERFAALVAAHEREKLIPKVVPDGRVSKTLFTIDDISKASEQGYQAALVEVEAAVLAEREACAKVCDDKHDYMCSRAAAAIRARGKQMTKLEQAARQALEALREYRDTQMISAPRRAIDSLLLALDEQTGQSQQADTSFDPVSVVNPNGNINWRVGQEQLPPRTKLYASPVRTKDLTDDELREILNGVREKWVKNEVDDWGFARAVIAADREKNK